MLIILVWVRRQGRKYPYYLAYLCGRFCNLKIYNINITIIYGLDTALYWTLLMIQ